MRPNEIVSHEEWLAARKALLAREKETTRALDRLRAERRALPWVKVEKPYTFRTSDGTRDPRRPVRRAEPARRLPLHARPGLGPHLRRVRVPVRPRGCGADAFRACRPLLRRRLPGAARRDRARQAAHGMALPVGVIAGQRLQLRFRRVVQAGAGRARRGRVQLRHHLLRRRGPPRHLGLRQGRGRERLPHLLDLCPRRRTAGRRLQLARPDAQGPQRGGPPWIGCGCTTSTTRARPAAAAATRLERRRNG